MSFDREGPRRSSSYANMWSSRSSSSYEIEPAPRNSAERQVTWLRDEISGLEATKDGRDWADRRQSLERSIQRVSAWAASQTHDEPALVAVRAAIGCARNALDAAVAPPEHVAIEGEEKLCAAIRQVAHGAEQREQRRISILRAASALSALARRQLVRRIRSGRQDDPVVAAMEGRMAAASRTELLGVLEGTKTVRLPAEDRSAIAARGTEGASTPLPFRDRIQASFGRHDVSGVRAHAGEQAADAAHALGAKAFAYGDAVAFAGAPDLHTAAHEAAHTIQQRSGLGGGTSAHHERGADEVADAVVRGHRAEPLLDRIAARSGSGATASVQLRGEHAATVAPAAAVEDARVEHTNKHAQLHEHGDAAHYFEIHEEAFLDTLRSRLAASPLVTGNAHLRWTSGPATFAEAIANQLVGPEIAEWPQLLYPADPWRVIDAHRTMDVSTRDDAPALTTGGMGWIPSAGIALASELELAIRRSLARTSARYVAAAGHGNHVTADELIPSHPMDRVVATVLCSQDMVSVDAMRPAEHAAGHDVQTDGIRLVSDIEWLGATDPNLWNWLRVREPADASVEEVAATLWNKPELAYGLTVARPFIAIPGEWARELPATKAFAPTWQVPDASPQALAESPYSDEVALVQGADARAEHGKHEKPAASDRANLIDALDSSAAILSDLQQQLDPYALGGFSSAQRFIRAKRTWLLSATPDDARRWAPVVTGQHEIVRGAAKGIGDVLEVGQDAGMTADELRDRQNPVNELLGQLIDAANLSMFVETGGATLARALAAQAMLPITLLDRSNRENAAGIADLRRAEPVDPSTAPGLAKELEPEQAMLAGETAELRTEVATGGTPDPELLETAAIASAYVKLRTTIGGVQHSLGELRDAIQAADQGVVATISNAFAGIEIAMVVFDLEAAIADLDRVDAELARVSTSAVNRKYDAMPASDGRDMARSFELREARRARIAAARQQIAEIADKRGLDHELVDRAKQMIHDERVRQMIGGVVAMIGIAVASGGVAAVAGDFVSGAVGGARAVTTVAEAANVARTARIAGGVTEFAVDAAANATGQTLLNGGKLGSTFGEFLLQSLAVKAALMPIQGVAKSWGVLDREAVDLWARQGSKWKLALAKGTVISAELITAAAVSYAVHRGMAAARDERVDEMTAAEWAANGATMVLGHYVSGKLDESIGRLRLAGRTAGDLTARMVRLRALAKEVEHTGNVDAGMELFVQRHQLLEQELELWRKIESDPTALRMTGMTRDQVDVQLHGAEAEDTQVKGRAFMQLQLRLAGLEQEVPGGRLWAGNHADIARMVDHARRMSLGVEVEQYDPATRQWRIKLGDEELLVHERLAQDPARTDDPSTSWHLAREQMLGGSVPDANLLPATPGNRDGLKRLADIHADETIPPWVRDEFMRDFGAKLRELDKPPENLFDVLNKIVYSQQGVVKYQRKGAKVPNIEYVRDVLGGLQRLVSLRALCQAGMITPEFYKRALAANLANSVNAPLPPYKDLQWQNGAQQVVDLIKSGALDFEPNRDLQQSGLIQGRGPGDSGWYFAAADADVSDVRSAQSQLAIGGAYLDGYVVFDLPAELALPDPGTGQVGASRPTALDLTADPLGKMNPDKSEPVGRTNPQSAGQVSAREVVMPPVPIAAMSKRMYVRARGTP